MIPNAKVLTRLWAAVLSDFEVCIGRFLIQPGCSFANFAEVAKRMRISLIMNICIGQGKFKEEHYEIISRLILDTARNLWLRPRKPHEDVKRRPPNDVFLERKRRLAGFYLTFFLYEKQPHEGRTKIYMDTKDLVIAQDFLKSVESMKEHLAIKFIFTKLKLCDAFGFQVSSTPYGVENWRRTLLTYQHSEVTQLSLVERDCQDLLAYSSNTLLLTKDVDAFTKAKISLLMSMFTTAIPSNMQYLIDMNWVDPSGRPQFRSRLENLLLTRMLPLISKAMTNIDKLGYNPILSVEQLTMDQIIQRRIMSDYRRWLQRSRKRIFEGPQKPKREYVRAGSIWGRKKEVEEGEEHRQRRERGGFSRNLFVYLHDLPFNYEHPDPPPE